MATYSSIHAWRIPWTEEQVGYSSWGCKELVTTEVTWYRHAREGALEATQGLANSSEHQGQPPGNVAPTLSCSS